MVSVELGGQVLTHRKLLLLSNPSQELGELLQLFLPRFMTFFQHGSSPS